MHSSEVCLACTPDAVGYESQVCALASNSTRPFSAETARAISRHFSASCRYASTVLFYWNRGLIGMTMRG
jgi:hypothetical protein